MRKRKKSCAKLCRDLKLFGLRKKNFFFNIERKSILKENQRRRRWKFSPCSWFCPPGCLEPGTRRMRIRSFTSVRKGWCCPWALLPFAFANVSLWLPPLRPLCGSLAVALVHCPFPLPFPLTCAVFGKDVAARTLTCAVVPRWNERVGCLCEALEFTSACVYPGVRGASKCVRGGSLIESTFHILSRMCICSIKKKKLSLGEPRCHLRGEQSCVGVGGAPFGSNRWFCNVSRPRPPQRRAMVTGGSPRPQPPSPLRVLWALRCSLRGVATVAGGASGQSPRTGSRSPRCLARASRAGAAAAARLARGALGRRGKPGARAALAGCLADTCLASPSTLSCRARPRAEALGLRA